MPSTMLGNSATTPSPALLKMCPRWAEIDSSITARYMRKAAVDASSSTSVWWLYPATSAARIAASRRSMAEAPHEATPNGKNPHIVIAFGSTSQSSPSHGTNHFSSAQLPLVRLLSYCGMFAWTCALLVNCLVVSPAVQHGAPHSQTCRLVPLFCMDMREIELLKSKTLAYVTGAS